MATRQRKKSLLTRLILPVFTIAFLGYFGFHAFEGEYGLVSYKKTQQRIKTRQSELTALQTQREALERRYALLVRGSPDREMIDELARTKLNVIHPNELVYLFNF